MRISMIAAAIVAFATTSAARADFTGKTIKIGVPNDQSGLYADLAGQGSVTAAKMAVEEMGGKIGDTPIEVIFADHQNKPDVGPARGPAGAGTARAAGPGSPD